MAEAILTSARKSRSRIATVLRDRVKQLQKLTDECQELGEDKTPAVAARHAGNLCTESLQKYHDSIVKIDELFITHKLPVQTQAQIKNDEDHENSLALLQKHVDEAMTFLARVDQSILNDTQRDIPAGNVEAVNQAVRPTMAKPQIKAPPLLEHDVDLSTFNTWRQSFHDWARATNIDKEPRDIKIAHLRSLLSIKMKATLEHAIGIDASTQLDVDGIFNALYQHIRATRSVAIDLVEFEKRVQGKNEKFDTFYIDLRRLALNSAIDHCCLDKRLITRLMAGCHDAEVREELMKKHNRLNLPMALEICRSKEAAKKCATAILTPETKIQAVKSTPKSKGRQQRNVSNAPSPHKNVSQQRQAQPLPRPPTQKAPTATPSQNKQSPQKSTGCPNCGFPKHLTPDGTCPAKAANCGKCSKVSARFWTRCIRKKVLQCVYSPVLYSQKFCL